jgi:hypothetical protein
MSIKHDPVAHDPVPESPARVMQNDLEKVQTGTEIVLAPTELE